MYLYELITTKDKNQLTYGIRLYEVSCDKVVDLCTVEKIALEEEDAKSLVRICNEGQLSPIHLLDVIHDFMVA